MTKKTAGGIALEQESADLRKEVGELRGKVRELEETLDAIRSGEVDAIVVSKGDSRQVYTLNGADHPYRALVENIGEGALTLSRTGMILYTNTRFAEMVQVSPENVPGTSILDHVCPEHRTEIEKALDGIVEKACRLYVRIRQGIGSLPVLISMSPLSSDENTKISVVVTDRREDESRIQLQARMLDAVGDAVVAVDNDHRIIFWNEGAAMTYGWRPEEVLGHTTMEIIVPELLKDDILKIMAQIERGESWSGEFLVRHRDGHKFPVHRIDSPVFDDEGTLIAIISTSHDISERRRAEEELVASVQEKEVLIHEIHHRVKNNLQVMSGLLDMTRTRSRDEYTKSILTDMMLRIQTMAQIHTRMYEGKQLGKICLTDQIRDQVVGLSEIFSNEGRKIRCQITPDEVFLPVDQALPCALVVNEILSNVYKHAFIGREQGTIGISVIEENGRIRITVRDNGIGLPDNFDISRTNSLGLKLIRSLVKHQLNGSLTFMSRNGTEISLEFPVTPAGK